MVFTEIQSVLTGVATGLGVDPVYFIFGAGLIVWLISVGASISGMVRELEEMVLKTRVSWMVLFLVMVVTQFTILTLKSQSQMPPTKYFFLQTVTGISIGSMVMKKLGNFRQGY